MMSIWESSYEQESIFKRRSGPDLLQRSMLWLGIISWLLFLLALVLFHFARPETSYGYLRHLDIELRDYWQDDIKTVFLWVLSSCSALSLFTFILNHKRSRRAGDTRWYNIALLLIVSAVLVLMILLPSHS